MDFFDPSLPIDITSRNLPHWTQDEAVYFVTFRLGDSLPQCKLQELAEEKKEWYKKHPLPLSEEDQKEYHKLFSAKIDKWLDAGYGACVLKNIDCAYIVEQSLWFYNSIRYLLHTYVIMSNHVHMIIQPEYGFKLKKIMHSIKSYTANQINKRLDRCGQLWEEESFDRIIRDSIHYDNVLNYIVYNIKHGGVRWHIPQKSL